MSNDTPTFLETFFQLALQSNGTDITQRPKMNVVGATFSDDPVKGITTMTVDGGVVSGQANLTLANGLNSNITTDGSLLQRIAGPSKPYSIGGIVPGPGTYAGKPLVFVDTSGQPVYLEHEDPNSAAQYRIKTPTGKRYRVGAFGSAASWQLHYDNTSQRYVVTANGAKLSTEVNVEEYGAKLDVVTLIDGAVSASSTAFSSASAAFTAQDVGKLLVIGGAALNQLLGTVAVVAGVMTGTGTNFASSLMVGGHVTIAGTTYSVASIASDTSANLTTTPTIGSGTSIFGPNKPLSTTIAAYVSPTAVTLGAAATVAVTGAVSQYGTDDAAAFQAAANASSGIVRVRACSAFVGSNVTLPNAGTKIVGDAAGTTLIAKDATYHLFTPQAPDQRMVDVQFQGQAVDSQATAHDSVGNTGQFAIKVIATKARQTGSTSTSFGTIANTNSFGLSIDAGLPSAQSVTVTFVTADVTAIAAASTTEAKALVAVKRINATLGNGKYNAVLSETGGAIYIYSHSSGTSASVALTDSGGTLAKLGLTAGTVNGTGTPAPRFRALHCIFTGADANRALCNGIKLPDGCDDALCDDLQFLQLAGSNGNSGAGYGVLLANNSRAKVVNSTMYGSSLGGRHMVYVSGGCTKPILANDHAFGLRSSSYHLFCHQSEPPTVGAQLIGCHADGQLQGEDDTAAIEFTGHLIDCQVIGGTALDCANNGIICSSYTYQSYSAPTRIQIEGYQVIRPGRNGVIFEGAQGCTAKHSKVVDASQSGLNSYYPFTVVSNSNASPTTIADGCVLEANYVEDTTAGVAPQYQQAIRFEPSGNGPTRCVARDNIMDPGTGADGNGSFITYQPSIPVTLIGNQARTLQTHTANNTAPSVVGTNFFIVNFSSGLPLNNLGGGYEGQEITLVAANGNCEIQANSNFALRDGLNWDMPTGAWIRLRRYGSTDAAGTNAKWYELSRSSGELYRVGDGSSTQAGYGFASEPGLGLVRTGSHGAALQANAKQAITYSDTAVTLNSGSTQMIHCDPSGVSVFGHAANGQQADVGLLTDSTGATPGLTISDSGAAYSQSTLNTNFSSLAAQINKLRAVLRAFGWTA